MSYTAPTISDFKTRFTPKFDSVSDDQITLALARGARNVDENWTEGDYAEGYMLYAAWWLTDQGLGTVGSSGAALAGFSEIRSGQLSLKRTPIAEQNGNDGSLLASNMYGRQYLALLRQNRPRAASTGAVDITDTGYYPFYEWGDRPV